MLELRPPTWDQLDRALKLSFALTWATLELAVWGARPQALAFLAAALGASETVRLLRKESRE